MQYLADTGILLRLFDSLAPEHLPITAAVRTLWSQGHVLVTTAQNVSEFWNVSTRPQQARGGFGQSVALVSQRVKAIERFCEILPFSLPAYLEWRRLVVAHQVTGVSVHDARIVATMVTSNLQHILTLNGADFRRYTEVTVLSPADINASV